jgi:tRNA (cmo5U34)-methyltransferase
MNEPAPTTSLGHVPAGKWEFDPSVTSVFDDMIARSIPDYASMREIVESFAARYGAEGGTLLDLGCSTGLSIKAFLNRAKRIIGVEVSESMLDVVTEKFGSFMNVQIEALDLRTGFPAVQDVDVTLAVFTLQFIPVEHRRRVVRSVYEALRPGGAFILAEKVLGESASNQAAFVEVYHRFKERQGYSREEVDRKALALEGRLVANTAHENVAMLRAAGFREVECIWRWVNFAAWVAVR